MTVWLVWYEYPCFELHLWKIFDTHEKAKNCEIDLDKNWEKYLGFEPRGEVIVTHREVE